MATDYLLVMDYLLVTDVFVGNGLFVGNGCMFTKVMGVIYEENE
ncbi:MAG: hypothetical protein WBF90_06875 [Rivularia sp. (in: cyanobacteria)]